MDIKRRIPEVIVIAAIVAILGWIVIDAQMEEQPIVSFALKEAGVDEAMREAHISEFSCGHYRPSGMRIVRIGDNAKLFSDSFTCGESSFVIKVNGGKITYSGEFPKIAKSEFVESISRVASDLADKYKAETAKADSIKKSWE